MISYCLKAIRGCNDRFAFVPFVTLSSLLSCLVFTLSSFFCLPQLGVIPFEIRTLKKGHTEKWRARRILYNKAIVDAERHRWCVEEQRIFASFINVFVYFITKHLFCKISYHVFSKLSARRTLRLCCSLCLRHLRDIVFYAFTSVFSHSLCAIYMPVALLYHSIFLRNLLFDIPINLFVFCYLIYH